jgi:hypothetical protein
MDDQKSARLSLLLKRQARARRVPGTLEAWRNCGVAATVLDDERAEQLIAWVKAHWHQPDRSVEGAEQHLKLLADGLEALLILDFWQWDEAVGVLVPTVSTVRIAHSLRSIYPDGYLAADQLLCRALVVNFDDRAEGAEIAWINAVERN